LALFDLGAQMIDGGRRGLGACVKIAIIAALLAGATGYAPTPAHGYAPVIEVQPGPSGARFDPPQARRREPQGGGERRGETPPRRRGKSGAAPLAQSEKPTAAKAELPLFLIVSIADQQVTVYNHDGVVARSAVSTGVPGHPTPRGVFTILGRERYHRSNIYSGAPMPLMQRVTWSGIAMHVGVVPGHPASHGCIRLPADFAARLWGLTKIGERIVISPHDLAPVEFAHPMLPTPTFVPQTAPEKPAPPPATQPDQATRPDQGAPAPGQQGAPAPVQQGAPAVADLAPPRLNPRQYAEQLKAKAASEAAAAAKAVKEATVAAATAKEQASGAAAELRAAEAAQATLQAKAERAAAALEAARAGQEPALLASRQPDSPTGGKTGKATSGLSLEKAQAAKDAAEAAAREALARLDAARTASASREAQAGDALARLEAATAAARAAVEAEAAARRRLMPLSVLISRKDRRIYARQGLAPIFDAPLTLRDPEKPIGSHLLIATAANADGSGLRWTAVSIRAGDDLEARKNARPEDVALPAALPPGPSDALQRIELTPDIRDRIAERLWVGASIIVSDQPQSGETGNIGTDVTIKFR
jgi:lipoprotein-anchoring transpeptidase ErfK/SrfK